MTGAPVSIRNVTVRYAGARRAAVDDVSLDIEGGSFVVLLGPSGCGKSTLLRTINRLIEPNAGTIEVGGRDVKAADPEDLRRGIGYVIQAVGLFPHMTVAQNIAVVPTLLGWDAARTATRVDELLELVRLEPASYRARLPRELSGGEQQRVGVARALAAEPPLLLMDEPFGAVDAIVRLALQEETARIHRALGTTILFVTHDVDEALRLADRIVVMNAGRIVQADSPLRILAHPATPYVAELLDSHDAVRRLGLLFVRDAMQPANAAAHPADATATGGATATASDVTPVAGAATPGRQVRIDAEQSLREALVLFLDGADRLDVMAGEKRIGTLTFDDVRRTMAAAAAA